MKIDGSKCIRVSLLAGGSGLGEAEEQAEETDRARGSSRAQERGKTPADRQTDRGWTPMEALQFDSGQS